MSQNAQSYNPYYAQQVQGGQVPPNAMYMQQQQQQQYSAAQTARGAAVYASPGHPHSPHASPMMYASAAPVQMVSSPHLTRPGITVPPRGVAQPAGAYAAVTPGVSMPNSNAARHSASPHATGRGQHMVPHMAVSGQTRHHAMVHPHAHAQAQAQAQVHGRTAGYPPASPAAHTATGGGHGSGTGASHGGAGMGTTASSTGPGASGKGSAGRNNASSNLQSLPVSASLSHLSLLKDATSSLCHAVVSTLLTEVDVAAHSSEFVSVLAHQREMEAIREKARERENQEKEETGLTWQPEMGDQPHTPSAVVPSTSTTATATTTASTGIPSSSSIPDKQMQDLKESLEKINISPSTLLPHSIPIANTLQQIHSIQEIFTTTHTRISDSSLSATRDFVALYPLQPTKQNLQALVTYNNNAQAMATMPTASVTVVQKLIISTPAVVDDTHTVIPVNEHDVTVMQARARAEAAAEAEAKAEVGLEVEAKGEARLDGMNSTTNSNTGTNTSTPTPASIEAHLPPLVSAPCSLGPTELKAFGLHKIAEFAKTTHSPSQNPQNPVSGSHNGCSGACCVPKNTMPAYTQSQISLIHNIGQYTRISFRNYANQYCPSVTDLLQTQHHTLVDRFNTVPKLARILPSKANGWSETEAARLVNQTEVRGTAMGMHLLPTMFEKSARAICKKSTVSGNGDSNLGDESKKMEDVSIEIVAAATCLTVTALLRILHPTSIATVVYVPENIHSRNSGTIFTPDGVAENILSHACASAVLPPILPSVLHSNFRHGYISTLLSSLIVQKMSIAGIIITIPCQRTIIIPIHVPSAPSSSSTSTSTSSSLPVIPRTVTISSAIVTPLSLSSNHALLSPPLVFTSTEDPLIFLRGGLSSSLYTARVLTAKARAIYRTWRLQGSPATIPQALVTHGSSLWLRTLAQLRDNTTYIVLIAHMILSASAVLPPSRKVANKPRKVTDPMLQLRRPEAGAHDGDASMLARIARVRAALGDMLPHEMSGHVALELETAARGV